MNQKRKSYDLFGDPIPSERFSFDKNKIVFTAEISDLGRGINLRQRLFTDACDEGFTMRSQKTGRLVRFVLTNEFKVHGEIGGWEFAAYREDLTNPDLPIRAVIFND